MRVTSPTSGVHRIVFALRQTIPVGLRALLIVSLCLNCFGQSKKPRKRASANSLKSVYIYNFSRFVTWPVTQMASAKEFRIGVVGESSIMPILKKLPAKRQAVDRRTGRRIPIRIVQFKSMKDYRPCHLLLVPSAVKLEEQKAILKQFATKPVLVVGESPGFARTGGTAGFVLSNGRMKFELNLADAKRKGLTIDAQLLTAANKLEKKIEPDSSSAVQQVP